jgi:hypothetical protein
VTTNVQVFDEVAGVNDDVLPFFAELCHRVAWWPSRSPVANCRPSSPNLTRYRALCGEFAQYLPPGGSMGIELDVADLLTRAGFVDVTQSSVEVCLEVPDARTYWDWTLTHGMRAFVDDLPADRRAEIRDHMLTQLSSQKVITLQRAAAVWTAKSPL